MALPTPQVLDILDRPMDERKSISPTEMSHLNTVGVHLSFLCVQDVHDGCQSRVFTAMFERADCRCRCHTHGPDRDAWDVRAAELRGAQVIA